LGTLAAACSPPGLASIRRSRSAHGVRPSGPCSSRSAVPLSGPRLSCRFSARPEGRTGATPEVDSNREGERPIPVRRRGGPNLALLSVPPLQGFLLRRLRTGFPVRPPLALPAGSAPYVSTSGRGSRVFSCDASGLPLSRLPAFLGFCTLPSVRRRLGPGTESGLWFRLGMGRARLPPPIRNGPRPDRSLASDRFGAATSESDHPTGAGSDSSLVPPEPCGPAGLEVRMSPREPPNFSGVGPRFCSSRRR
jgi:hypothetical protein